jgi:tetratricopeptide (TPR) repeat protein
VKPEKGEYREWMEFEVPEVTTDTAKVVLRWENVAVPFTVNTGSTDRALASAKQAIGRYDTDRWQLPYRAADFAFQNNRMDEAKLYLDQALKAANENMATLWLKARMQQKAGDKAAAIKTAELALTKATDNDRDFAADIRKTVDRWRQ